MDQHTTKIPRVRRLSKAMSALTIMHTNLVGTVIHSSQASHGKEVYGSFDYYQWPHNTNITIIVTDILWKWNEEYKQVLEAVLF